jgi:ribosomal protein L17
MASRPWPDIPDEQRWSLELMEERLERTAQPARELSARADELRTQAAQTDIEGYREAALALADRYEQAAAARLSSA